MPVIDYRAKVSDNQPPSDDVLAPWVNADKLSMAERADLKAKVEAGEIQAIRTWLRVFGNERNANGIRPHPDKFKALLEHRRDVTFKTSHWGGTPSIAGRVFDRREFVRDDGVEQLEAAHEITVPEAMVAYIDGRMTDFSISLNLDDLRCSLCEEPLERVWFWLDFSCKCKKNGLNPEAFAHGDNPELMHNAWVPEGAYRDTGTSTNFSATADRGGLLTPEIRAQFLAAMKNNTPCGCEGKAAAEFGDELARVLNDAIDEQVDDETTRADVVERMASAAGIEASTVNEILSGSINCPPFERLEAFADVLDVDIDDLTSAGEDDGCTYTTDDEEEAEDMAAKERIAELEAQLQAANDRARAAEDARFSAAFDAAVSARKVTPARKAHFQRLYEGMGIEFALETLGSLEVNPAYDPEPTGFSGDGSAGPEGEPEPDRYFAADASVEAGVLRKDTVEAARAGTLKIIRHPALARNAG